MTISEDSNEQASPMTTAAGNELRLVKIKFRTAGRHYDFGAQDLTLHAGDRVIVETDRGRALGTVVAEPHTVSPDAAPEGLKNVLRHAGGDDLNMATIHTAREIEAARFCRDRIIERHMEMKLVRAEYLFDGSKIIFYFTADGRIDFRELVKDLAHYFHTRIEMRQIGVRDEAKLTGGIGICGRELCCSSYLTEFAPVSVKMAKEQGLALNPNKISGQCGRLLCCLGYEYETYCDLKRALPKCGRKVMLDGREGEVIDQNILRQTVTVSLPGEPHRLVLTVEQIEKGVIPPRPGQGSGTPPGERPQRSGGQRERAPQLSNQAQREQREQRAKNQPPQERATEAQTQAQAPQQQGAAKPSPQPQRSQQQRPPRHQSGKDAAPQPAKTQPQPQNKAAAAAAVDKNLAPAQENQAGEGRRRRHRNRRRGQRNNSGTPTAGE